jgi:pyrroloquinoline quinone biosynthesis protein B
MQVVLLGTAAGGGFPQWNCWCPSCRVARAEPRRAHPRSQSSVAVRAENAGWVLLNASPDVRGRLELISGDAKSDDLRRTSVEATVLTDAELDHTLGLVLMRESGFLRVYATEPVERVLAEDSRILPTTRAFGVVEVERLPLERSVELRDRAGRSLGLFVEAFAVAGDRPRFATDSGNSRPGHVVGLLVSELASDAVLAFVPGVGIVDAALLDRLAGAKLVLIDGTFWTDDELASLGVGVSTAREMGHVPIDGPGGSLGPLRRLASSAQIVYTHINNTNPILIEDSAERRAIEAAGIRVGDDGMRFDL